MQNKRLDFVAMGGSLFVTFVILGLFYSYILVQQNQNFDFLVDASITDVQNRMVNYEQVLYSAQGLFRASDHVSVDEWQTFVQNQHIGQRFPGVQIVAYSEKIGNSEDLVKHIEQMRLEYPDYTVRPDTQRDEYHSIIYIEPINTRNLRAFGYDMFTEPVRRTALEHARDTDTTTISGKVKLVQEIDKDIQPGFLMYLPVYKNGLEHSSVEQKRTALQGFVYCAFRTYDLFDAMLATIPEIRESNIRFKVFDSSKSEDNLLYDSKKGEPENSASLYMNRQLEFGNRIWVIEYSSVPEFTAFETVVMVTIPAIGVSMSAFVFIVIRTNQRNTNRIIKLNEDLLKSEKLSAVGHIASRLAHDIRNPLSVIKNTSELLLRKDIDEKTKELLSRIDRSASKINNQVNGALDFVRTKPLQVGSHPSDQILSETFDRIEKPSGITINVPKTDYTIKCDLERIEIALANLITNSIQALDGDGTINISIQDNNKFVTIEVEDSGPGIPKDVLPKIFEPLFTTKPDGTGLGLASVKNIIDQHGGSISVKNNPTTFTINLPK
jgi:signal transduction histidine kinase